VTAQLNASPMVAPTGTALHSSPAVLRRPPAPKYAIVVATRNRGAKIVPLLESVLGSDEPDFEMVIVDQSQNDGTRAAVAPYLVDERIRYVFLDGSGTSRARNFGIRLTSAPIIAITDDDCLVPPDWLTLLARPFAAHPKVGIVFCTVTPAPASTQGYTPHIHYTRNATISDVGEAWATASTGLALGAGMALRRGALPDLVGFDEFLGPGGTFPSAEDNDLAWRALISGWTIYQNADVAVVHDGLRTFEELKTLVARDHYAVGGASAKYLKAGHWGILHLLVTWVIRFGIVDPAKDLFVHRLRPRGFRRPYHFLRGVINGLRRPVDPVTLRYKVHAG